MLDQNSDKFLIQQCIPAHLLFLMLEECEKEGLEMRSDVKHKLNVATVAPVADKDPVTVRRVALHTDTVAVSLLHLLAPDDPRHGLYACAMFVLLLVAEGRLQDKGNMAVLVALMLMEDAKDDRKDTAGNDPIWHLEERKLRDEAKKLVRRANLSGYYLQNNMQSIATNH